MSDIFKTPQRIVRAGVTKAKQVVGGVVGGTLGKAAKVIKSLGTERYDRASYVSEESKRKKLISDADEILSRRPDILNESDYKDGEFQTVVNASHIRK